MKVNYQREYVRCGKKSCGSCPHGPYWYAYWSEKGKTRKRYVGKELPSSDQGESDQGESDQGESDQEREIPKHWKGIFEKRAATTALAEEILELFMGYGYQSAKIQYRKLVLLHHPDRGGSHQRFAAINAAWSYLCGVFGWK